MPGADEVNRRGSRDGSLAGVAWPSPPCRNRALIPPVAWRDTVNSGGGLPGVPSGEPCLRDGACAHFVGVNSNVSHPRGLVTRWQAGIFTTLALAGLTLAPAAAQSTPEAGAQATPLAGALAVNVLGVQTFPSDLEFDGTLVGGLSGIDYDPASGEWIAISDDRSDNNPARYYDLDLSYGENGFDAIDFQSVTTLLQGDGQPYPNKDQGGMVPDPESIRFDPATGAIWYTSEGSWELGLNPFVAATVPDGHLIASPTTPGMFTMDPDEATGPRENLVFEGLSFASDGASLWLGMEGPLYQDGEMATADLGPTVRLTNIDRSGNVLAQYAYPVDPIPVAPAGFGTSGVTEVLAVDADHFLIVERASAEDADGVFVNFIKVYEADFSGATNVQDVAALAGAEFTPVAKRLVLDLNAAGVSPIDNIEGITWGPDLPNGNRTLLLIADNNFNETQVTEFVALEVLP